MLGCFSDQVVDRLKCHAFAGDSSRLSLNWARDVCPTLACWFATFGSRQWAAANAVSLTMVLDWNDYESLMNFTDVLT